MRGGSARKWNSNTAGSRQGVAVRHAEPAGGAAGQQHGGRATTDSLLRGLPVSPLHSPSTTHPWYQARQRGCVRVRRRGDPAPPAPVGTAQSSAAGSAWVHCRQTPPPGAAGTRRGRLRKVGGSGAQQRVCWACEQRQPAGRAPAGTCVAAAAVPPPAALPAAPASSSSSFPTRRLASPWRDT